MADWHFVGLDFPDLLPTELLSKADREGLSGAELYRDVNVKPEDLKPLEGLKERIPFISTRQPMLSSQLGRAGAQRFAMATLAMAAQLDAGTVCMTGDSAAGTYEAARREAVAALRPVVREAERLGVTLCVENVFDRGGLDPSGSPRVLREICDDIASENFGVNLDIANVVVAGADSVEAVGLLGPFIRYMHWKDVALAKGNAEYAGASRPLRRRDGTDYVSVPMGIGDVPLEACWNWVIATGIKVPMALELYCVPEHRDSYLRAAVTWSFSVTEHPSQP